MSEFTKNHKKRLFSVKIRGIFLPFRRQTPGLKQNVNNGSFYVTSFCATYDNVIISKVQRGNLMADFGPRRGPDLDCYKTLMA